MSSLSKHHVELTNGVGKCSKPMWQGGLPAGFCDDPAYGRSNSRKYSGYVPALACPNHGGPEAPQSSSDDNSCGRCGHAPARCTCLKPAENE